MLRPNTRIKRPEPRSDYVLELTDLSSQKRISPKSATAKRGGFGRLGKRITGVLTTIFILAGTFTGLTMSGSSLVQDPDSAASADIWDMGSWFCPVDWDSPKALLGGNSNPISSAYSGAAKTPSPSSGAFLAPAIPQGVNYDRNNPAASGNQLTSLEMYGYFVPTFESWAKVKMKDGGPVRPYAGTGGRANSWLQFPSDGSSSFFGQPVEVTDSDSNPFFAHGFGDCANFGGSFNAGFSNLMFSLPKFWVALSSEVYGWAASAHIARPLADAMSPGSGLSDEESILAAARDDSIFTNPSSRVWETCDPSPPSGAKIDCSDEYSSNPMGLLGNIVNDIVTGRDGAPGSGLRNTLFLNFLAPVILIGVIGLMWNGIVRKGFIKTLQNSLWMIIGIILGAMFMMAPLMIVSISEAFINTVKNSVTSGILANTSAASAPECELPSTSRNAAPRQIKCVVWYTTIYAPWVQGQYGWNVFDSEYRTIAATNSNDENNDGIPDNGLAQMCTTYAAGSNPCGADGRGMPGEVVQAAWDNSQVVNTSHSVENIFNNWTSPWFPEGQAKAAEAWPGFSMTWPFYQMSISENLSKNGVSTISYDAANYSEIAWSQMMLNPNATWRDSGGAIGAAFLAMLASVLPGLMLFAYSAVQLMWMLMTLILLVVSPIVFLVGIIPGYGKSILAQWGETMVGLAIKQIMAAILVAIWAALFMAVVGQGSEIPWIFQQVLIGLLTVVFVVKRDEIIDIFVRPIKFGGAGTGLLSDQSSALNKKSGVLAAAAAGGFIGAGVKTVRATPGIAKGTVDKARGVKASLQGKGIKDRIQKGQDAALESKRSWNAEGREDNRRGKDGGGSGGSGSGPNSPSRMTQMEQEAGWDELNKKTDFELQKNDYKRAFDRKERKAIAGAGDAQAQKDKANEIAKQKVAAAHADYEKARAQEKPLFDKAEEIKKDKTLTSEEKKQRLAEIRGKISESAGAREAKLKELQAATTHEKTKREQKQDKKQKSGS